MHSQGAGLLAHALGVVHRRLAWLFTLRHAYVTTAAFNAITHPMEACRRVGLGLVHVPELDYDVRFLLLVRIYVYPLLVTSEPTGTPAASV